MSKYSEDVKRGENRPDYSANRPNEACKKDKCKDNDYSDLGRELFESAINMETGLGDFLKSESKNIYKLIEGYKSCQSVDKNELVKVNETIKKTISYSSLIEVIVLIKIIIALITIHHDSFMNLLEWVKENVDLDKIDINKIINFFKNQDWEKFLTLLIGYFKSNPNLNMDDIINIVKRLIK